MNNIRITACAPAKIVLSGEYSVLYGASALAAAISLHLRASIETLEVPIIRLPGKVVIEKSLEECVQLSRQIDQRYEKFVAGRIPITAVLKKISDLQFYTLARHFNALCKRGISLQINSLIPIGSGFGSSSAIISAISLAAASFVKNPFKSKEKLISEIQYIERLQHGKSGFIDATTIVQGGVIQINSKIKKLATLAGEWWAVNTGRPETSTGECVASVHKSFANSRIWSEFNSVTNYMTDKLKTGDEPGLLDAIKINEALLETLGIVPESVRQFIRCIEKKGAAAKVSGAGSIKGDKAGVVLVRGCNPQELAASYGYSCYAMKTDKNGSILN